MAPFRSIAVMWPRSRFLLVGLALLLPVLAGCTEKVEWEVMQRQSSTLAGDLYGRHSLGQTFVPRHDGLSGIEVLLADYGLESDRPAVPLELRLCRDARCQDEAARTTIPVEAIAHNRSYRFRFAPQPGSAGQTYLLLVTAPQALLPARTTLWAHASDLYVEGTRLYDDQPVDGDLTFWTFYETSAGAIADETLRGAWDGLRYLPGLLILLLAPGYLLARLLPRSGKEDLLDLVGCSLGLSVAAVPVLLLLLAQTPLRLNGLAVQIGGGLLGALALGLLVWDLRRQRWPRPRAAIAPVLVAMAGVIGVGLFLRTLHALDLVGPLWVDAVHHSLLARIIIERGAIPTDYRPYADVAPATYHFGFQSLVAVLHWLTGMPLPKALLCLGQTLSGLVGLPLYLLGKRLGKSRWAGLGAALLPTALVLTPAYYVSWSRYTELVGLMILPVAAVLLERWCRMRRWHVGLAVATTVALAGIVVTHLRVAAFLAVLAGLLVLAISLRRRYQIGTMVLPWARALVVALVAATLTSAWLWPSIVHLWLPAAQEWGANVDTLLLSFVLFGPGRTVAPIAVAGAALGLFWRRREALLLLLWTGLIVLMANPSLLGIRLGAVVDNTSVGIALFVPLSLGLALAAGGLASLGRRLGRRVYPWLRWGGAVLIVGLSVWGSQGLLDIVNSRTALLTEEDLAAMAWIEGHIPAEALFLINSYEWTPGIYAGMDGGYWIAPLTGRRTWPPPALYGFGRPAYIEQVGQVSKEAMDSPDGETLYRLAQQHGFTHVYLGRYGGPLRPETLLGRPEFRLLYQRDGVWIFAVEPPSTSPLSTERPSSRTGATPAIFPLPK